MTNTTPISEGATMPALTLETTESVRITFEPTGGVVYFMRTASCPVCHAHLRHIERLIADGSLDAADVAVVVPGTAADASAVAGRHAPLAARVYSSITAHTQMGLFVKLGLQQSGTYVTDPSGVVTHSRVATMPTSSFDAQATVNAYRMFANRKAG